MPKGLRTGSSITTLWRINSTTLHGYQQEDSYLRHQVCSLLKQDNFKIMIPYYVCNVKYPILSASKLLDRGYGLDFTPRHCTITHGQQQAHLIRHSGLFYLRVEKTDIPTGFDIYPMTTDNGQFIAVIQPTEKAIQQQEQVAPLTHTNQGLRQSLVETNYWKLNGDYAIRVHKRPRKALFTPHNSGYPIPERELDDWRLTDHHQQTRARARITTREPNTTFQARTTTKTRRWHWRNQIQKKDTQRLMDTIKHPTTSTTKDMET